MTNSLKIGDRVEYIDAGAELNGKQGTVTSIIPADGTDKYAAALITVKRDDTGNERCHFDWRMKKVRLTATEKHGYEVGQKVRITDNALASVAEYRGKIGTIVDSINTVMIKVQIGDARKYFYASEIEAYVNLAGGAAEKAGYKVGDRVETLESNLRPAGLFGTVIAHSDPSHAYYIRVYIDGDTEGTYEPFEAKELKPYTKPERKFAVGSWVEVTGRNDSYDGIIGQVQDESAWYWEGEKSFFINIIPKYGTSAGKSLSFLENVLKPASEPWAPKFKKGDWVEVPASHNAEWAGIGQITEEATEGLDIAVVRMDTATGYGKGRTGGFSERKLIAAEEPKPVFKFGDRVEVVEFGDPDAFDYNKYKGEFGTVIVAPEGGFIRLELDSGPRTPLFLAKELKHTTVQKPKPKLWTEEAEVGQSAYTAHDKKIGRVLHKVADNTWKVTYPADRVGDKNAIASTYDDDGAFAIAPEAVLV